jgi:hypothetical protein
VIAPRKPADLVGLALEGGEEHRRLQRQRLMVVGSGWSAEEFTERCVRSIIGEAVRHRYSNGKDEADDRPR